MSNSKVLLRSVKNAKVYDVVEEILEGCGYRNLIREDTRVAIKVNLSTPYAENAAASNTSPEILDAVCNLVTKITKKVAVGESNGMRYPTEDAFEVSGYLPILEKYGITPTNFSKDEWVETGEPLIKGWGLPRTLVDADVFITLPVLKTHATTVFTGALKNQFGCYPQHNRILLHPKLDDVIVLINRLLKPRLCIMDGIIAMEGRGPINGVPRQLDVILGSNDPVALDATAMRLVGIDPMSSRHITKANAQGVGEIDEGKIEVDGDFAGLSTPIEPAEQDLPIKALGWISHSRFLTEKLILNPEAFYPLRSVAMVFREIRDFILRGVGAKDAS